MLSELLRRNEVLGWTAIGHGVLFLIALALTQIDGRQLAGINIWIKPMKFAISIALYTATFAWIYHHASASGGAKALVSWVIAGTLLWESLCIFLQAGRGVGSHFNFGTLFDGFIFTSMGVMILINMLAAGVGAWHCWQTAPTIGLKPAYLWGIRLGMLLFVLAGLEGGLMAARLQHAVGVPDGGPGLRILNWSTEGGDLRAAHFVGMHALQALPLLGYCVGSVWAVWGAAAGWAGVTAWLLLRALAGRPFPG
ncbi:MAG: hypothetical protein INH43_08575 [Acidobacteriaceae bacterium]|jgi:hypothetical protein|nr:hypothetical protein [Acidobacteriaceae bacterium]